MSGEYLPLIAACAFAANIKFCDALGPAPQSIYCFTISVVVLLLGLVFATNPTAYSITLSATGIRLINC